MTFSEKIYEKYNLQDFIDTISIPEGICVTINAMDLCIRQNDDLKCSLNVLKYGLHELPRSQLKPLCHKYDLKSFCLWSTISNLTSLLFITEFRNYVHLLQLMFKFWNSSWSIFLIMNYTLLDHRVFWKTP